MNHFKRKPFVCILYIVCLVLSLGCPAASAASDLPVEFSSELSFVSDAPTEHPAEYLIALDSSGSMRESIEARNAAAASLLQSLPYENTRAGVLFFSDTCESPLELLPMNQAASRQQLTTAVEENTIAQGGTDLSAMIRKAVDVFSNTALDPAVQHVLFVVTDGQNDGSDGLAEKREQEFFSLCQQYKDTIKIYIVYISPDEIPESLCDGLHTQPITPEDAGSGRLEGYAGQLDTWGEEESAKILSIPDFSQLEASLLLLRFTGADAVFSWEVEQETVVSFLVPPLCTQELTISLSGGVSAQAALSELQLDGSGVDFLRDAQSGSDPSTVTVYNEQGFPPGLYTVRVKSDEPVTAIISYKCSYKIRFGWRGRSTPLSLPVDSEPELYMQLLTPDGVPADAPGADISMRIELQDENGVYQPYASLKNFDTFDTSGLTEQQSLRFYPVVSYPGVGAGPDVYWDVQMTETLAEPPPAEAVTPGGSTKGRVIPVLIILGMLSLVAGYAVLRWIKQKKETQPDEQNKVRTIRAQELHPNNEFIRATISWQIREGEKACTLGLGLRDENGNLHTGCDLKQMPRPGYVKPESWIEPPLDICVWQYSPEYKYTELILKGRSGAEITAEGELHLYPPLKVENSEDEIRLFGVSAEKRYGTVTVKSGERSVVFHMEYCRDGLPFYHD